MAKGKAVPYKKFCLQWVAAYLQIRTILPLRSSPSGTGIW